MIQVIKANEHGDPNVFEVCGIHVYHSPYIGITRGYGEFMDHYKPEPSAEWVVYQPHDVALNYFDLRRAIDNSPGKFFQLSLSDDSYGSHEFLFKRKRQGWHRVPFVEIMVPVFKRDFYDVVAPYMKESKSGWGLDYLWAHLYGEQPWLCCDYEMRHKNPITSHKWLIDGKTPMDESSYIVEKYLKR
jgi:hypothetical protein